MIHNQFIDENPYSNSNLYQRDMKKLNKYDTQKVIILVFRAIAFLYLIYFITTLVIDYNNEFGGKTDTLISQNGEETDYISQIYSQSSIQTNSDENLNYNRKEDIINDDISK